MASGNTVQKATPMFQMRNRHKGAPREPCLSVKEICQMYGMCAKRFAGLASHHPIQAQFNCGSRKLAMYSRSTVVAWAALLSLEKV